MKSNFTKKKKKNNRKQLYNCISAVACNKYSILTCRKARNIEFRNRIEHSQVHNSTVFSSKRKKEHTHTFIYTEQL